MVTKQKKKNWAERLSQTWRKYAESTDYMKLGVRPMQDRISFCVDFGDEIELDTRRDTVAVRALESIPGRLPSDIADKSLPLHLHYTLPPCVVLIYAKTYSC